MAKPTEVVQDITVNIKMVLDESTRQGLQSLSDVLLDLLELLKDKDQK